MGQSTEIAKVPSSHNDTILYRIIQRANGNWECDCPAHFLSDDRRAPCKHITRLRSLRHLPKGALVSRNVRLTKKGEVILRRWRRRNDLPEVKE